MNASTREITRSHESNTGASARAPRKSASLAKSTRVLNTGTMVLPVIGVAASVVLFLKGRPRSALVLGGASVAFGLLRNQLQRAFTEEASYAIEYVDGDFEIRTYAPQIRVETAVHESSFEEALERGFRRVAGYIFGRNHGRNNDENGSDLARERKSNSKSGRRIAMTIPVLASVDEKVAPGWHTIAFVMPADETRETLPAPIDPLIHVRSVGEERVAVLRFSGRWKDGHLEAMRNALLARLEAAKLEPDGDVFFAGYDPPMTMPALRRNEVLVRLR